MDPHRKSDLVAALRSGRYSQTRYMLRYVDSYCCLGVACDISGVGRWEGPGYFVGSEGAGLFLPEPVRHHYGLTVEQMSMMTEWNDKYQYDFHKIADLVEEQF